MSLYGPEWTPEMKRKDRREVGMLTLNLFVLVLLCATGLIFVWLFVGGWNRAKAHHHDDGDWAFFWFW